MAEPRVGFGPAGASRLQHLPIRGSPGLGKNCYSWPMSMTAVLLGSSEGWRVYDVRCTSGPQDRPFEERHSGVCIALVTSGTFTYRTTQGTAVLAPGAALLGNSGHCFECGHEHGVGDRCLSFDLAPEFVESVVSEVPGVRRTDFALPSLPPVSALIPMVAEADAALHGKADVSFEQLALGVVATVARALADA